MLRKNAFLRLICITLVSLILILSTTAMADTSIPTYNENFSIRNGVCFGMEKSEVEKKEHEQGNLEGELYYTISNALLQAYLFGITTLDDFERYIVDTTVAGENCLAIYTFDETGKMDSLRYLVNSTHQSCSLTETLMSKYGSPLFIKEVSPFESKALNFYRACSFPHGATLSAYSGWLVRYKNYYVLIESVQFNAAKDGHYYENITYTPISDQQYTDYQNSLIQEQNSIVNDM